MRNVLIPLVALLACTTASAKESETVTAVMTDRYFLSLKCDDYLSQTTADEKEQLINAASILERYESMRFISGKDSVLSDWAR